MSDNTLYVTLKNLAKALDNYYPLEVASQKMNELTDSIKRLNETLSGSLELNVKVDDGMIKELQGGYGMNSATLYFDEFIAVPRRKHKKKRIQKKWAKRYGFITKCIPIGMKINDIQATGNGYEFTGVLK